MTDSLLYKLELGVGEGADVEAIEEHLQEVLVELYEQEKVEAVRVIKDGYTTDVDDAEEIADALEAVDSEAIRKAIDSVLEMENIDE